MPLADTLKTHDPFKFQPPESYSPWSERLLIDLRRRLKEHKQTSSSLRRVAKIIDIHLARQAEAVLLDSSIRSNLVAAYQRPKSIAALRRATTAVHVRSAVSDLDLLFAHGTNGSQYPPGWSDSNYFVKAAVVSLAKFAEALDARPSIQTAVMGEGFGAGCMAIGLDNVLENVKRERKNLDYVSHSAASTAVESVKQANSAVKRKVALSGHQKLWGPLIDRSLVLVSKKQFKYYTHAAKFIQPILQKEFHRSVELDTICGWLKSKGWRPAGAAVKAS
jgi:hypothetical protein